MKRVRLIKRINLKYNQIDSIPCLQNTKVTVSYLLLVCVQHRYGSSRLICWGHSIAIEAVHHISSSRNLKFRSVAGNSSPTLHKGHCGIFNAFGGQSDYMLDKVTSRFTAIQETEHTLMNNLACETPGLQFTACLVLALWLGWLAWDWGGWLVIRVAGLGSLGPVFEPCWLLN